MRPKNLSNYVWNEEMSIFKKKNNIKQVTQKEKGEELSMYYMPIVLQAI